MLVSCRELAKLTSRHHILMVESREAEIMSVGTGWEHSDVTVFVWPENW